MSNEGVLTQEGPEGIRFDFMDGCRVWLPDGAKWRVELWDVETETRLFDQEMTSSSMVHSSKRYYVPFEFKVWKDGKKIFTHRCNLRRKDVLISMELGGLGDHLAWVGHAIAFQELHKCRLTCKVHKDLLPLFSGAYKNIRFISPGMEDDRVYYAQYKVLVFFNDTDRNFQPNDYRQVGLALMGAYILGLPIKERRPDVIVDKGGRPIQERYVCIGTQASGLSKYWHNPTGWFMLVKFLKENGYRVICIDRSRVEGTGDVWRSIPHGVEDQTGNRSLTERARWLKYADFFVGLSSGLSWLAWAVETPVVMISGYTEPYNEFYTPYRIINRHVCNSCANDVTQTLQTDNRLFCPYHANTSRMFECSKAISVHQVQSVIKTIPGFGVQS
ncbi:autotransporter strand-loop-strand O-heptosyltransferase [Acetobacteraceae bacterium ESL0709]|nr:autotransporter strand-loop-strand O-heptosyltransferase [Acetobacteraceae bacterium ESL0697]MDF7678936.1 autotransporter strand-loop-strand O-heptosyltransferase [Acetobacteraceae bacterium ESL0709]